MFFLQRLLYTYTSAQDTAMTSSKWTKGEDMHDINMLIRAVFFCFCLSDILNFKCQLYAETLHLPAGFGDIRVRGSSKVTSLKIKKGLLKEYSHKYLVTTHGLKSIFTFLLGHPAGFW